MRTLNRMMFLIKMPSAEPSLAAVTHMPKATPAWGSRVMPKYFLTRGSHLVAEQLI